MDATAGSGAGEGIGAGAGALAGLGASVFGDSSTTGVATRGATKVVSKAAKSAPDAVTKVGKGLAAQSDVALKSAKAAAQSDAARLASKRRSRPSRKWPRPRVADDDEARQGPRHERRRRD